MAFILPYLLSVYSSHIGYAFEREKRWKERRREERSYIALFCSSLWSLLLWEQATTLSLINWTTLDSINPLHSLSFLMQGRDDNTHLQGVMKNKWDHVYGGRIISEASKHLTTQCPSYYLLQSPWSGTWVLRFFFTKI